MQNKLLSRVYNVLKLMLISVLLSSIMLISCTPKDEGYTEEELEQISKMQELTDKIQKDLNQLNKESSKSDPKNYDKFKASLSSYDAILNKTAVSLNNEEAGKEEFIQAAQTYQKIIDVYKKNGQNVSAVQTKIDKLLSLADKINN